MNGEHKITSSHRERTALIYLRQSTLMQVRQHTESTLRQYALADTAIALGWAPRDAEGIDRDLGLSGTSAAHRAGFRELAGSSRGSTRPWCIQAVYLFEARQLRSEQIARGVRRGVASSVIKQQWEAAEIYPSASNPGLPVTSQQAEQLRLFAP